MEPQEPTQVPEAGGVQRRDTCLTHTVWLAFNRLKQAYKTLAEFTKVIWFLEDQANAGLEVEKQMFRLSCNHPNMIPHWLECWKEG